MSESLPEPLIVAHRGSSAGAPENTLAAFRQALGEAADGVEFDVQLAGDGVPIVFHDFTLNRIARKKIRTSKFTSSELKNIDVGAWFNAQNPRKADEKFTGETVSTLAEVFDFLKDFRCRIYVELKCRNNQIPRLVCAVVKEIRATRLLSRLVLKSFTLEAVKEAKNMLPEIQTAALFAPKITSFLHRPGHLIERAKRFSADELSVHHSLAKPGLMKKAAAEKMRVTIWTADNPVWIERALDLGIYAIITNDPARLLKRREEVFNAETRRFLKESKT